MERLNTTELSNLSEFDNPPGSSNSPGAANSAGSSSSGNNIISNLSVPLVPFIPFVPFVPDSRYTIKQNCAAVARFCLIFVIIVLLFDRSLIWVYLAAALLILTGLYYFISQKYPNSIPTREYAAPQVTTRLETFTDLQNPGGSYNINSVPNPINNINYILFNDPVKKQDPSGLSSSVEVGFYDSDNNLRFYNTDLLKNVSETQRTDKCKEPTINNPFMNTTLNDYNIPEPPAACNALSDQIKEKSIEAVNASMYRNIDDTYNTKTYNRLFYTTPSATVPNNAVTFANWLYKAPETCKQNCERCLPRVELRQQL